MNVNILTTPRSYSHFLGLEICSSAALATVGSDDGGEDGAVASAATGPELTLLSGFTWVHATDGRASCLRLTVFV